MAQMHQKTDEIGCKSKEKKLYIETKTSNLAKLLNVYMIYMAAAIAIVCHFDEKKFFRLFLFFCFVYGIRRVFRACVCVYVFE